jgi:hypothetical protein
VTTETIKVLKDIMRKYPDFVEEFVPFISKISLDQIEDIEGKTGFVWMLGAFCEQIPEAPYMIETFLKDMKELDQPEFSIILLISTFRMFFKRAPETKHILAGLFKEIMTNSTDTDLK